DASASRAFSIWDVITCTDLPHSCSIIRVCVSPLCARKNQALFTNRGLALFLAVFLAVTNQRPIAAHASNSDADQAVCDPLADYYLGMEDYPDAIRRHREVIQRDPGNALAHYHLGFAYGAIGDHHDELDQYQKAIALGLNDWQLFLNLGLLYADDGRVGSAVDLMRLATLLGPYRPETHFNLGLLDERLGLYQPAEQEMLLSLRLDPDQLDARNQLGVIYAEEGNYRRAREEWTDLLTADPQYSPAHANLELLRGLEQGRLKRTKELSGLSHSQ
ncbi:MAG TPA: tetratricopeptide repeat protein, partial [Candidatus Binataceae bacterium]|nr:tetratricopeptide repeat protein [Candidatus Binataceae bacterium]